MEGSERMRVRSVGWWEASGVFSALSVSEIVTAEMERKLTDALIQETRDEHYDAVGGGAEDTLDPHLVR